MSTALKKEHKLERPPRGGLATMVEAIRQGLWEEMERDPTVFLIGEDVGVYGGGLIITNRNIDEVGPGRVIDTPIARDAAFSAACGAAFMGLRPRPRFSFLDFFF